jgi:hypothetical protein
VENKVLPSGDRDDRTGELASINLTVQRSDDPAKSRGGHADRFRLRTRQRSAGRAFVCGVFGHVCYSPFSWRSFSELWGKLSNGGGWVNPIEAA